jgi:branched-chain amino acid transport system permease protein
MPAQQLRNTQTQYIESGSGTEAVVFVHGFVASRRWWQPAMDRLPAGFHAYAVDLRAMAREDQTAPDHTIAQYAADLHEFVEALGLDSFHLVGHSLGGGVAMLYALEHQERLKSLLLVDPLAPFGTKLLDPAAAEWVNAQYGNRDGITAVALGGCVIQPTGPYREQLIDDAMAWGRAGYRGMMDDMARYDITARLGELTVPTLVTWGDKDMVIPFQGIVEAFTKIPGCGLEIWHGVGHDAPIELPDRLTDLAVRFFGEAAQALTTAPPA